MRAISFGSRCTPPAWSACGALMSLLVALSCATQTRLSSIRIQDLDRNQLQDLKTNCDAVARRFSFDADAEEYLGRHIQVGVEWTIVASYSNRGRGMRDLVGGRGHVEFSVLARSDINEATIIIEDYHNAGRTEYVAALEDGIAEAVREVSPASPIEWRGKVVRALRP